MTLKPSYVTIGKRLADFTAAATLLVATAPLHATCALAVLVGSGRPVYYCSDRAGLEGKPFGLLKFRTMYVDTEVRFGAFPPKDAVTPIGRMLRRTSLDEIPQLVNVLRGDMSLVGPRPALLSHVDRYTDTQKHRLAIRPGMTGLAQILYRNSAPWSTRIEKDLEYVRNVGFAVDVCILLKTVPSVLFGVGQVVGQTPADVDDLAPGQSAGLPK